MVVHQNHDYGYHPQGKQGVWQDEEARRNMELAGGARHLFTMDDATHRLTTAIIFDLPIGKGRWIGSGMNSIADAVVGGWSLESFLTFQSGQPIAIVMVDGGRLTDGNQRPNVICSQLTTGIPLGTPGAP